MDLQAYFENTEGTGILATADGEGKVDLAVYAKPHFMEEGVIAFIMAERLTHKNLQTNGHAAYLFLEESPGYKGLRLFLKKVREEKNTELIHSIRRRTYPEDQSRYLVFFTIEKQLPLIGAGEEPDEVI
jgi:hypothetical protein